MPRDRSLGRTPRKESSSTNKFKKINKRERVLYLPALDESTTSAKAAYLADNYYNLRIVDYQASMWNPMTKHCFWALLCTTNECLTFATVFLLSILLWLSDYMLLSGFMTFIASFFLWREWPKLTSKTWYKVLTACLQTTRQEMFDFNPTVVVGSSFGGAVSVFCLLDDLQHTVKPVVLLAPMHAELNRQMVFDWHGSRKLPEQTKMIIAHGDKDATVQLSDSQKLAASDPKRCTLHVIPDERHRLKSLVGKGFVESTVSLMDLIDEAVRV
jgi:predicted alpha/beta hydrolase family esterase|tara:strand:- start:59 stop:871 length:813 start_codon:yes stop_codon:yes gene_type:complete